MEPTPARRPSPRPRVPSGALLGLLGGMTLAASAAHAANRIDTQRPDAPELAAYGELETGVRPIDLVNPDQIDIVAIDPETERARRAPALRAAAARRALVPGPPRRDGQPRAADLPARRAHTDRARRPLGALRRAARERRPLPARDRLPRLPGQPLPDVPPWPTTSPPRATSSPRSITPTRPTAPRPRSARRCATARSISCSCSTRWNV